MFIQKLTKKNCANLISHLLKQMASSLAFKKLISSNLISTSLRAIRPIDTASRFCNTNAAHCLVDDDNVEVDHRPARTLSRDQLASSQVIIFISFIALFLELINQRRYGVVVVVMVW